MADSKDICVNLFDKPYGSHMSFHEGCHFLRGFLCNILGGKGGGGVVGPHMWEGAPYLQNCGIELGLIN